MLKHVQHDKVENWGALRRRGRIAAGTSDPVCGSFGRWAEKANFPEADASTVRGNSIDGTIARVDKP
jgi:hypothetical protein